MNQLWTETLVLCCWLQCCLATDAQLTVRWSGHNPEKWRIILNTNLSPLGPAHQPQTDGPAHKVLTDGPTHKVLIDGSAHKTRTDGPALIRQVFTCRHRLPTHTRKHTHLSAPDWILAMTTHTPR